MRKIDETIFYLCDGEVEGCSKSTCYKIHPECEHACQYTQNINHARNFARLKKDKKSPVYTKIYEKPPAVINDVQMALKRLFEFC